MGGYSLVWSPVFRTAVRAQPAGVCGLTAGTAELVGIVPHPFWPAVAAVVGENPKAVDTAGISVAGLRYRAVIIAGVLCGFAGAYLSTAQNAQFIRDMTAGQASWHWPH
ncbi:MAG: hypothetical protein R3E95_23000 [Thiolinea sp.]